jgi:hypothetical protein
MPSMRNPIVGNLIGLAGAVVGGFVGLKIFLWLAQHQSLYGLMIPGALVGLGSSMAAPQRSMVRGLICGIGAVVLALYAEWSFRPFKADDSFGYLVAHASDLQPMTLLMLAVGACFAFWLGKDASPFFRAEKPDARGGRPAGD